MSDADRIKHLEAIVRKYNQAADKFIRKVETGLAHSKETYKDLKTAREMGRAVS